VKSENVPPLKVNHAIAGMQFEEIDAKVLEYLGAFNRLVDFESLTLLHVVQKNDAPNLYEEGEALSHSPVNRKEMKEKLLFCARFCFADKPASFLKIQIREGSPLEELLNAAEQSSADLLVIGQKTGTTHHGIPACKFARKVHCHALIVPQEAQTTLRNILVPVDFSPNSAKALHEALTLNAALRNPAKITLLHTCEIPANFSTYRFNEPKVRQLMLEERQEAMQKFIATHLPERLQKTIESAVTVHRHQGVAQHLMTFANSRPHDLIIMGAKGHSKAELLFMGSVTEKLLSLTRQIAVLVVR
jgi:nucleotide-binding universal stress UspA family protein